MVSRFSLLGHGCQSKGWKYTSPPGFEMIGSSLSPAVAVLARKLFDPKVGRKKERNTGGEAQGSFRVCSYGDAASAKSPSRQTDRLKDTAM